MHDLIIEFFVPRVDSSKAEGKHMLQMICDLVPELMPEFYNTYEPVNKPFDSAHLDDALGDWNYSFLWKRKKPSVSGVMFSGTAQQQRPRHTHIVIRAKHSTIATQRLGLFVRQFSSSFRVDLALAHVLTKPEIESKRRFMLSTHKIKISLPNLYWITAFGAPYVGLFGRERLLSTPAVVVEQLGGDLVYLQLTDDLLDTRREPERVEKVRDAAKRHLGNNAFSSPELGETTSYRVPQFNIQEGKLSVSDYAD